MSFENHPLLLICIGFGAALVLMLGVSWLTTRFAYRITPTHIQVTLFGVPVRWVRLTDIASISRHGVRWGEHWWNTNRPFRRVLVIRRRSGLFRNFVITPWHRYIFKAEMERAIAAAAGSIAKDDPGLGD